MANQPTLFLGNTGARSQRSSTDADPGDMIRAQRQLARKTQEGERRALLVNALMQQRAQAIAAGVMATALPEIHGQMSEKDLVAAQTRMNTLMGQGNASMTAGTAPNQQPKDGRMIAGQLPGGATANGQVIVTPPAPAQQPVPAVPKNFPDPAPVKDTRKASDPDPVAAEWAKGPQVAGDAFNSNHVAPAPAPVAATATSNPVLDQMVRDGTLPAGASLSRSGAGFTTNVQSESGPRSVAIQPTAEQALVGRYDQTARTQYGKGWADLNPDQRRAILQSTAGHTEMVAGHRDLPENAFKGFANAQYGSGYATTGPRTMSGPKIIDENGPQPSYLDSIVNDVKAFTKKRDAMRPQSPAAPAPGPTQPGSLRSLVTAPVTPGAKANAAIAGTTPKPGGPANPRTPVQATPMEGGLHQLTSETVTAQKPESDAQQVGRGLGTGARMAANGAYPTIGRAAAAVADAVPENDVTRGFKDAWKGF